MKRGFKMFKRILLIVLLAIALYFASLFAKAPQQAVLTGNTLEEASGLAHSLLHPKLLYSHNDSGGKNAVYAMDYTGEIKATIIIDGIKNRDWEDIATAYDPSTGKPYIFIGEIGDNNARYPSIAVFKVPEPSLARGDSLIIIQDYETINIQFEDGPRDAEALFVESKTGDIYIISKREEKVSAYVVSYPYKANSINIAKKIATLNMNWVTAADISPNGKQILIKTYTSIYRFKRSKKMSIAEALTKKPAKLPYILEPQGEAICFDLKGKGYFTLSEAAENTDQILYYYK